MKEEIVSIYLFFISLSLGSGLLGLLYSLGIPETSLRGRSTRTALKVLRSTEMFMWAPAAARILPEETKAHLKNQTKLRRRSKATQTDGRWEPSDEKCYLNCLSTVHQKQVSHRKGTAQTHGGAGCGAQIWTARTWGSPGTTEKQKATAALWGHLAVSQRVGGRMWQRLFRRKNKASGSIRGNAHTNHISLLSAAQSQSPSGIHF